MANRERTRKVTKPVVIENDMVPIEKLIDYAKNSRTHSKKQIEQLAASITEFGFVNPVLVWKQNEIIAGHGRVAAARTLIESDPERFAHLKFIPVRRCDHLTDAQRRALVIADNKLALNADWDEELLAIEMIELRDILPNMDVLGFTPAEVEHLTAPEPEIEEIEGDPDNSRSGIATDQLTFGSIKIKISKQELKGLEKAAADYAGHFGSYYGFVTALLKGNK